MASLGEAADKRRGGELARLFPHERTVQTAHCSKNMHAKDAQTEGCWKRGTGGGWAAPCLQRDQTILQVKYTRKDTTKESPDLTRLTEEETV